jgi:putative tricarboxylic transport membrane protein
MAHTDAILILICVYVGAIYGGSRTGSCSTFQAPRPMRRRRSTAMHSRRRAGRARDGHRHDRLGDAVAVRRRLPARLTPLLAEAALKFRRFEFFWLALSAC